MVKKPDMVKFEARLDKCASDEKMKQYMARFEENLTKT